MNFIKSKFTPFGYAACFIYKSDIRKGYINFKDKRIDLKNYPVDFLLAMIMNILRCIMTHILVRSLV